MLLKCCLYRSLGKGLVFINLGSGRRFFYGGLKFFMEILWRSQIFVTDFMGASGFFLNHYGGSKVVTYENLKKAENKYDTVILMSHCRLCLSLNLHHSSGAVTTK